MRNSIRVQISNLKALHLPIGRLEVLIYNPQASQLVSFCVAKDKGQRHMISDVPLLFVYCFVE